MESSSIWMFLQSLTNVISDVSGLPGFFTSWWGILTSSLENIKEKTAFVKNKKEAFSWFCVQCTVLSVHCNLCLLYLVFSESNLFTAHSWSRSCNWELWKDLPYISLTHPCLAIASSRNFADAEGRVLWADRLGVITVINYSHKKHSSGFAHFLNRRTQWKCNINITTVIPS